MFSRFQDYRVLKSITECYRVLQNITEYYSVFIAHLLGPIFGLVLTGPPDFQNQNEKTCSANEELFYIENFVKN